MSDETTTLSYPDDAYDALLADLRAIIAPGTRGKGGASPARRHQITGGDAPACFPAWTEGGHVARRVREDEAMPEVYTGKVLIPGDQIDAYLAALKVAEEARRPFRERLEGLNEEFGAYLEKKYSRRTARKHTSIVDLFIIFLCDYTDVERLEDVTRGMVNSHFRRWYRGKVLDRMDLDETRVALKKFFGFLDQEKGIHNPKALDALR